LEAGEQWDTVCCFSVTKWMHYSGGDAAIRRVFQKMFCSLAPNGILILEPQPWSSYKKKSNLTPQIKQNYKCMQCTTSLLLSFLLFPSLRSSSVFGCCFQPFNSSELMCITCALRLHF
jgi:7SK snRNA methylphosphate capping enzyme